MLPWQPFLAFYILGAHWRHLKNTTEPSMCGGDAALCQITLTTCSLLLQRFYTLSHALLSKLLNHVIYHSHPSLSRLHRLKMTDRVEHKPLPLTLKVFL